KKIYTDNLSQNEELQLSYHIFANKPIDISIPISQKCQRIYNLINKNEPLTIRQDIDALQNLVNKIILQISNNTLVTITAIVKIEILNTIYPCQNYEFKIADKNLASYSNITKTINEFKKLDIQPLIYENRFLLCDNEVKNLYLYPPGFYFDETKN